MRIIRNHERGRSRTSWLNSRHTFSFADYYNPKNNGVSALRVINDDLVEPSAGFDTHSHNNVEIITYVLEGMIEHKDSLGNITQLNAGDFQVMTTGTGVTHSEYNPSKKEGLHFLQIWIWPDTRGLTPAYDQKAFPVNTQRQTIASPNGPLHINQDATLERLYLKAGNNESLNINTGRCGALFVVSGELEIPTTSLSAGDTLILNETSDILLKGSKNTEALWFNLPL